MVQKIIFFIKRTLSRHVDDKSVRDFERVLTAQDNQRPFANEIERAKKSRDEYLDSIGYPKESRD